jgi:hypothetical protein
LFLFIIFTYFAACIARQMREGVSGISRCVTPTFAGTTGAIGEQGN